MCNLENMYSYTGLIFETVLYIYLSLSWFQCFAWDSLQVSTGHIPIDIASMIHISLQDPFCHCRSVPSLVASFRPAKITVHAQIHQDIHKTFTFPPFNCGRSLINTSIRSRVRGTGLPDPISVVWRKFTAFGCTRKIPRSRPFWSYRFSGPWHRHGLRCELMAA